MLRRLAALALLLSCSALAHADDAVWQGTIGTASVVVELPVDDDTVYGRYFYTRHRRDIPIEGRREAGVLHLKEDSGDWTLHAADAGALAGEWTGRDGRRLPVHLTHARTPPDPDRAALAAHDLYAAWRIDTLRLRPARLQTVGAYRLQWYDEPTTDVELFQVVGGYGPAERARLNRLLRDRHWSLVASAAECRSMDGGEYDTTTTLRRIAPEILSVSLFASWSCGGAHPDFGDDPLNVDPRTGRVLDLEDVLWLGTGTPPRMDGATQQAFFDYRDAVLAPWLARAMARHHPAEMRRQEDDADGCAYADAELWKFPSWYATDAGLYVGPSFPRVVRSCEYPEWSVLPWREVRAHPGAVRIAPR
ncbi:DUF3298 domain-containing protein [Lysobacter xanthus]